MDVPAPDRARTIAHLADTVQTALGHASRHAEGAAEASRAGDAESVAFNIRHVQNHVAEAVEHIVKLIATLKKYEPAVADELGELHDVTQAERAQQVAYKQTFCTTDEGNVILIEDLSSLTEKALAGAGSMQATNTVSVAPPFSPRGSASEGVIAADIRPESDHLPPPQENDRSLVHGEDGGQAGTGWAGAWTNVSTGAR